MSNAIKILIISLSFIYSTAYAQTDECHAAIDEAQPQFIVGYGSLILEKSKRETAPGAGDNIPVTITGYQRGWFLKGPPTKHSTTFLGIKASANQKMNAVVFQLLNPKEILNLDERETGYCRHLVALDSIQPWTNDALKPAQYWIYVPQPDQIAFPSDQYPLVQSYVDIFLSGCIQMEKKFQLQGYATQCVSTTSNWSKHWINDRLYPRRPWTYMPDALQIDKMLIKEVPDYYNSVQVE